MLTRRRNLLTTLNQRDSTGGGDLPSAIPDQLADFDADELIGVIVDAAKVTSWTDSTGGNTFAHGTAGNQPVFDQVNPQFNGHASVNFTKANTHNLFASTGTLLSYMSGADKPLTVFAVARRSTKVTADEVLFGFGKVATGTASAMSCRWRYASSNTQRQSFAAVDDATTAATLTGLNEVTDLAPQVLCWSLSGATWSGYIAGATLNPYNDPYANNVSSGDYSTLTTITLDRASIGAHVRNTTTLPAEMELARLIVYGRELSEAERVRVSDYLYSRYCANPTPLSIPTRTSLTVAHEWDCSGVPDTVGDPCSRVTNSIDITNDLVASGSARPTVRLDAATGNKYLEFDGAANVMNPEAATAANWAFLHSGASSYGLWIVYRISDAADDELQPILDTNGGSTTAQGISIAHDADAQAHSIQIKIGNGSAIVINHDSIDYGSRPGAWHVLHLTVEASKPSTEETYQIWLDNENYTGLNASNAADADAAVGSMLIGKLVGVATFGKFDLGKIIITNTKPGRPGASLDVNEALASAWGTSHCALVGGNGLADDLSDATPHRGFPAMCQDANGTFHVIYRRGTTHGTSRGVGVHCTSSDGIRWSNERVIYDVNDADGRDFRGGGTMICLTQGAHAGRLLFLTNWSADDSNIEVTGVPSTNLLGISDDNGGSWTWSNPQENDTKNVWQTPWEYTVASAASMIELSTGRILMTFASNDVGLDTNNQDLNIAYSDNGGETWSDSVIIGLHDVCFNNQLNKRVTESWIVEWDDATLTMFVRNDTDKEIWRATSTVAAPTSWTFDAAKMWDGWGRPMFIREPGTASSGWMFHRADPGDLSVWRYTTDKGATWTAARAFSNLHQSTPFDPYNGTSYHYAIEAADGAVWVCYGLERQPDGDIWVRRWSPAT